MKKTMQAHCPSCQTKYSVFILAGQQHWPPAVAAAHNLPEHINLWTCAHCKSTLSECALETPTRGNGLTPPARNTGKLVNKISQQADPTCYP